MKKTSANKRSFWTIAKGTIVGYVEEMGTQGVFFTNQYISLRPTTSNLASNGDVLNVSVSKFGGSFTPVLEEAIRKRLPVTVTYSKDLFGWPSHGEITEQIYLHDVKIDAAIADVSIDRVYKHE